MEIDIVTRLIEDGNDLSLEAAEKILSLRERGKFWERTCKKERVDAFVKRVGIKYQPKGGMCKRCEKSLDDCSGLDFSEMKVIDFCDGGKTKIVRCNKYERLNTMLRSAIPRQQS